MDLLTEVEDYIVRYQLLERQAHVIVGVSGGPDSVTLLHLLARLAETWELNLHVAHLHHGIRDKEADADAEFVAELADRWELPYTIEQIDVPALARQKGLPLEEAARRARYTFLLREAHCYDARVIAVGHNAHDQAETVLMHILRGAGPSGLRGMLPRTPLQEYAAFTDETNGLPLNHKGYLIRPLLKVRRAAIEDYCTSHKLKTRLDCSNLDTTYFRNQLRHEVLPYLEQVWSNVTERLVNLAEVVRADYALLEEFTQVAWDELLANAYPDALVFNLEGWRAQPLSVQRALLRRAVHYLRHSLRDLDFEHVENAVQLVRGDRNPTQGKTGARATLPQNLVVRIGYTTLTIADRNAHHLPTERPWLPPGSHIAVQIPGKTHLPEGWLLHAEILDHWSNADVYHNPNDLTAWMQASDLPESLYLRTREQGDRFQPQGLKGRTMRLSDFLVNVKLPRAWRNYLPLLVAESEILWVVGMRLSERVLVRPDTKQVLRLRFLCCE